MIDVAHLSKRYGDTLAVDDLTFTVRPGVVTGFLGPNGSGKSTTMRVILGLDAPSDGTALVAGRRLAEHPAPLTVIGALLDARAVHGRRSAHDHLHALAVSNGLPRSRVGEVLDLVGLGEVARRAGGGLSLGMGQRLGIAAALLGDPGIVMLDEPVNGLDPEGIPWIRHLLQSLAREGRTVFVSSHLMSEMELMADHLVIIGRGRLIADLPARDLRAMASERTVAVRATEFHRLGEALRRDGVRIASTSSTDAEVTGLEAEEIGRIARDEGIALAALIPTQTTLEEIFMRLTADTIQYQGAPSIASEGATR